MRKKTGVSSGPTGLQNKINLEIRQKIHQGVYPLGEKLPPRAEFEKKYKTTPVTVQKVFDKLTADGYVFSKRQRGTFVAENPPCFSNYAIVFPHHFDTHQHVSFFKVLVDVAQKSDSANVHFSIYTGLNGHQDEPGYKRLYDDFKEKRIAGVIFASNPYLISQTPLYKDMILNSDVPRIAFMGSPGTKEIPAIGTPKHKDFQENVFNYLKKAGVRKLAVLMSVNDDVMVYPENGFPFLSEAGKYGIQIPEHWIQGVNSLTPVWAERLVHLMFHQENKFRPDGLWINDDSLVKAGVRGLKRTGMDLDNFPLVCHCNFPEKPENTIKTFWYGLEVEKFLESCIEILVKQQQGVPFAHLTKIPIHFQED